MTRLGFFINRTLRREAPLAALSVSQEALLRELSGKSVALVGNARALAEGKAGAEIDAHDVVIRINRAPMPSAVSHGTRTDWLALATSLPQAERTRINPGRILWMSHKRKRLDWETASSPGFYLHPLGEYEALKTRLGAQPTTGAMLIDMLARSDLARLDLYGFDFFASLSLSGRRTADKVPHDFAAEAEMVARLTERDPRIIRN
ncbi:MAG: glycosyltransferase family 29 protein [Thioclava marina]|uniref:glycosyltransferase family 29 protein n=1 Tax=Thioclava marina TaxID=1915077 RepID=UPI0019CC01A8|nr:glycosyltransferase family 29 protein [Thioclava marina]MBC7146426.1 glycosyltransferase family 29 protein [Thioclava marina]